MLSVDKLWAVFKKDIVKLWIQSNSKLADPLMDGSMMMVLAAFWERGPD